MVQYDMLRMKWFEPYEHVQYAKSSLCVISNRNFIDGNSTRFLVVVVAVIVVVTIEFERLCVYKMNISTMSNRALSHFAY